MWDNTKPQDDEPIAFGDDRIRELKKDLEDILKAEHHFLFDGDDVKLIPKIVASTIPPDPELEGRIYFNTLQHLQTFFIRYNNNWVAMSNNFDTIPSGTILVSNKTGVFIRTLTLNKTYALKLNNIWLENISKVEGQIPYILNHNHNLSNYVFTHSHSIQTTSPQAKGADADSGGVTTVTVAGTTHRHNVRFEFPNLNISHSHSLSNFFGSLRYYQLKVYMVEY